MFTGPTIEFLTGQMPSICSELKLLVLFRNNEILSLNDLVENRL